jgi:hypothetical protein
LFLKRSISTLASTSCSVMSLSSAIHYTHEAFFPPKYGLAWPSTHSWSLQLIIEHGPIG